MSEDIPSSEPLSSHADFSRRSVFRTTRWDIVRLAQGSGTERSKGMERLARTYWYPLYAFARRQGINETDAQDRTQGFLAEFVNGSHLKSVDPKRGKFRSFLLTCFKNHLSDEHARATAQKRGGGMEFVPLDESSAEEHFQQQDDSLSLEDSFDLDWAQSLMSSVLERLRAEAIRTKKENRFKLLYPFVTEDPTEQESIIISSELGLGESGLRSALKRFRVRFGEYLWTEIASTVEDSNEVKSEMRYLLGILSSTATNESKAKSA